jgi:lysine 2,3-aminomutase
MTDKTLRQIDELHAAGLIHKKDLAALERVAERYSVAITSAMTELIDPNDPLDPMALQFVPDARELIETEGESADPIGDETHSPVAGIVHRYADRALLKLVHACPVYCRFCFRRETVGAGGEFLSGEKLEAALSYIARTPALWEIIITGGDPFILSPRRIKEITTRLSAIDHVKIIRWHTRVPLVEPERMTDECVAALKSATKTVWISIHTNHPREFSEAGCRALGRLADAGLPLIGQSVLLRGINDEAETLIALFRTMVENRIKPYYLHQGDYAPGTSHFRTDLADGERLMRNLRGRLSGLAQPTYVLDIPGGAGKVPIGPTYRHGNLIEDPQGALHPYPPKGSEKL